MATLMLGDNLEILRQMASASVDAVVTDPPYGIEFMGKDWDKQIPSVELWSECLRVLKPGGHLLAFGGVKMNHRQVCNIEDAGFEIRDVILWLYGSGFPKSQDVGGMITRKLGPDAKESHQWSGWGCALKPAYEPITMARKPLAESTLVSNVLTHGVGALNIDASRVLTDELAGKTYRNKGTAADAFEGYGGGVIQGNSLGRFPANLVHDGSDDVLSIFPIVDGAVGKTQHGSGTNQVYGKFKRSEKSTGGEGIRDTGSAARFFYCAKASKKEKNAGLSSASNSHPTVKPVALMRHLIRLVTPPGGIVLDPFMGSGSTGCAAVADGFEFIGIEIEASSLMVASERIRHAQGAKGDE